MLFKQNQTNQVVVFVHEDGAEPEVKTRIVKMMQARMGGKVTIKQKLAEGTGLGSLWIGSSRIHNPESNNVNLILENFSWTNDSTIVLDNSLVNYPFLVISANFADTQAAKVEVEVEISWSLTRGL